MSCNRENVTWQSKDGTWNIGFYAYYAVNEDSEDWDYEWDVEYEDYFDWVALGKKTPEEAYAAYTFGNANPGGTTIYSYEGNAKLCDQFDAMALQVNAKGKYL